MNSTPTSEQMSGSTFGQTEAERVGPSVNEEMSKLHRDVASLKDTITRLASQVGGDAAKTFRGVSETVASRVGSAASGAADAGSELASAAKEHAKTFASELEAMARRNPLGTIVGVLLVGIIIGMVARGRD